MGSNYCICCGAEIPEGTMACKNCNDGYTKTKEIKRKLCEVIAKAAKPIEYGGDLYHAPEVYYPTEWDILEAMLASGLIKLNLGD